MLCPATCTAPPCDSPYRMTALTDGFPEARRVGLRSRFPVPTDVDLSSSFEQSAHRPPRRRPIDSRSPTNAHGGSICTSTGRLSCRFLSPHSFFYFRTEQEAARHAMRYTCRAPRQHQPAHDTLVRARRAAGRHAGGSASRPSEPSVGRTQPALRRKACSGAAARIKLGPGVARMLPPGLSRAAHFGTGPLPACQAEANARCSSTCEETRAKNSKGSKAPSTDAAACCA